MKILVTGGASGLGASITAKLAGDPSHQVCFTYCSSKLEAGELKRKFKNTEAIEADFKNQSSLQSLLDWIQNSDLDILINNAIAKPYVLKHFHASEPSEFEKGFQYNILPAICITQAAIKVFRKKRFGKIITILSSFLAHQKPVGLSEYVASKAYMAALSQYWALENAAFNITANCISPSFMLTGLTKNTDERIIADIIQKHPLKKLLTTDEVADVVKTMVEAGQHFNGNNILLT